MDIKGAVRNMLPMNLVGGSQEAKRKTALHEKTESTADRDANGQQQGQGEQGRRGLSEEELQEAIKVLEALPGVKDNGLTFKLVRQEGVPVVLVEDRTGKVVRRIPETELSMLKARDGEKKTGHLLNRAM